MRSNLFFELLQVALGRRSEISSTLNVDEWKGIFATAQKQALVGVCFTAIEKLPAEQRPPREILLQWYAITQQIEARNRVMNRKSVETCRYFEEQGFKACVLKGQGNAQMYVVNENDGTIDMRLRRQSGDIDVWCVAPDVMKGEKCSINKSRSKVLKWVRQRYPNEEFDMKHIHFHLFEGVPMEVHFVPSLLRDKLANRHLMRFYEHEMAAQMEHSIKLDGVEEAQGKLIYPTWGFNVVFQLTHIFNHFLTEGVGLRQVMDYYFLLRSKNEEGKENCEDMVASEAVKWIKKLRLLGFAGALMWVMKEVLGLKEEEMLVPVDEKRGKVLLDEILAGGNFGQHESRYWYQVMSRWKFYLARMRRMLHFLRYYPSEVLWDIPSRIWQRIWMRFISCY